MSSFKQELVVIQLSFLFKEYYALTFITLNASKEEGK